MPPSRDSFRRNRVAPIDTSILARDEWLVVFGDSCHVCREENEFTVDS